MNDIFDSAIPKYSTAHAIYDALSELVQTEEMSILSEIGADVSYDNQTYYYTDKGYKLKERFEEITDYCEKIWLLDLAIFQLDKYDSVIDIHSIVFDALAYSDLAAKIRFKSLFIEHMLKGNKSRYEKIREDFFLNVQDLNYYDTVTMMNAFAKAAEEHGINLNGGNPYPNFIYYLKEKINNLNLLNEIKLVADCRALLTSYDDFILGLKMNQRLYEMQEQQYQFKVQELQESYREKIRQLHKIYEGKFQQLILFAQNQGVLLNFDEVKLLGNEENEQ